LHSRLDIMGGGPHMRAALDIQDRVGYLDGRNIGHEAVREVPADLNLVLFSGDQIDGSAEAVFYQIIPLHAWGEAQDQETRQTTWGNTFKVVDSTGEMTDRTGRQIEEFLRKRATRPAGEER
jgi:hypothetical protein